MSDQLRSLLALRLSGTSSNRQLRRLRDRHGDFVNAARQTLAAEAFARADAELLRAEQLGDRILTEDHPDYPIPLGQGADPPVLLYVRGDLGPVDDPAVAIIGARRASPDGRRIARTLAEGFAALGITVVSGLARGIDGDAHRGSLEGGGRTLAVLGSGLDVVYPSEHRDLARAIPQAGALVSEFPFGTRPARHHFPVRNRVIATLARAVVVIEAAEQSGSLITAHCAADEGRAVLAVPGSPLSLEHRGSNRLLQEGARLVLTLADVLDELPGGRAPRRPAPGPLLQSPPTLTDTQTRVHRALSHGVGRSLDEVAKETGLAATAVASTLVGLELGGHAVRMPGGRYVRAGDARALTTGLADSSRQAVLCSNHKPPGRAAQPGCEASEQVHGQRSRHRRVASEGEDDQ